MFIHPPTLDCAVLSSSSTYELDDLFAEVMLVSGTTAFDLMLLRDTDVRALDKQNLLRPGRENATSSLDNRSLTRIMAESDWEPIADWIIGRCKTFRRTPLRIAALATYYPDIVSLSEQRRALAVSALANTARIGLKLQDEGLMTTDPIIEIVCGQILDTCECGHPDCKDLVIMSSPASKYELLLDSCREVVARITTEGRFRDRRFALGLELEPGENYVLKDAEAIDAIMSAVKGDDATEATRDGRWKEYVGLNLDIAHMIMTDVTRDHLARWRGRIVHAHIADHPGVHTKDQYVGKYMPIQQTDKGGYRPYFELLWDRFRENGAPLPFSGAIALELEGCNRSEWIHGSLSAMRHLIASSR